MRLKNTFNNPRQITAGISNVGRKVAGRVVQIVQPIALENAKINCPHCSNNPTIIGVEGEVVCPNCQARYFEWNPSSILSTEYNNVPEVDQYRFSVLLFQIAEHLENGAYYQAKIKCGQAFEISETTAQVWVFAAYCTYFDSPKEIILKQDGPELLSYLERADYIENEDFTAPIRLAIGYHLYHFLLKKLDFLRMEDVHDYDKFKSISFYIYCLKFCYALSKDVFFLKELVAHFYGQKKENWFDYKINDLFLNKYEFVSRITGAPSFSALELDQIILKIKEYNPDYEPPIMFGGDFYGKEKMPLGELLNARKKHKEKAEESFRIAQIEKEERKLELTKRKEQAKVAEKRNRLFIIGLVAIWVIFVLWAIYNYAIPVLFFTIIIISVFKTRLSP